ncbi:MAG: hypothetical protein EZS28_027539 [Streblomastix strix]|uniref:Reverse transcriptase domain-containing protein n=1 Tax=Streblomastix strix TaxID=222440 RepID=A0A5J4V4F1_9EUKA|nr:MAG: hypothetical protein EZS28_027539 [Streblomastix strix]
MDTNGFEDVMSVVASKAQRMAVFYWDTQRLEHLRAEFADAFPLEKPLDVIAEKILMRQVSFDQCNRDKKLSNVYWDLSEDLGVIALKTMEFYSTLEEVREIDTLVLQKRAVPGQQEKSGIQGIIIISLQTLIVPEVGLGVEADLDPEIETKRDLMSATRIVDIVREEKDLMMAISEIEKGKGRNEFDSLRVNLSPKSTKVVPLRSPSAVTFQDQVAEMQVLQAKERAQIPLGGCIRAYASAWDSLSPPFNLIYILDLSLVDSPPHGRRIPAAYVNSIQELQATYNIIQEELHNNVIIKVHPWEVNPNAPHFKMEDARTWRNPIFPGAFMVTIDLKHAYLHVPDSEEASKWLCFEQRNQTFKQMTLCFGLSTVSYSFIKLKRRVLATLRPHFTIMAYLNDVGTIAHSIKKVEDSVRQTLKQFLLLVLKVEFNKSKLQPSHKAEYLGCLWDYEAMSMEPIFKRIIKGWKLVRERLKYARRSVQAIAFTPAKLIGVLQSMVLCMSLTLVSQQDNSRETFSNSDYSRLENFVSIGGASMFKQMKSKTSLNKSRLSGRTGNVSIKCLSSIWPPISLENSRTRSVEDLFQYIPVSQNTMVYIQQAFSDSTWSKSGEESKTDETDEPTRYSSLRLHEAINSSLKMKDYVVDPTHPSNPS